MSLYLLMYDVTYHGGTHRVMETIEAASDAAAITAANSILSDHTDSSNGNLYGPIAEISLG